MKDWFFLELFQRIFQQRKLKNYKWFSFWFPFDFVLRTFEQVIFNWMRVTWVFPHSDSGDFISWFRSILISFRGFCSSTFVEISSTENSINRVSCFPRIEVSNLKLFVGWWAKHWRLKNQLYYTFTCKNDNIIVKTNKFYFHISIFTVPICTLKNDQKIDFYFHFKLLFDES